MEKYLVQNTCLPLNVKLELIQAASPLISLVVTIVASDLT